MNAKNVLVPSEINGSAVSFSRSATSLTIEGASISAVDGHCELYRISSIDPNAGTHDGEKSPGILNKNFFPVFKNFYG